MRKTILSLLALAMLLSVAPVIVHAETATAAAPDAATQRKRELVQRYFKALDMENMMRVMMDSMMPMMTESLRQQHPEVTDDQTRFLSEAVIESLVGIMPKYMDSLVDVYADAFTEEELVYLVDFYENPLGKRIMQKAMDLTPQSMKIMQDLVPELQANMVARLCSKIDCSNTELAPKRPA